MFILNSKYCSILDAVPICCVDVIIKHESKILLIHRKQSEDFGDLWWIPGGRIYKNEKWENAVKRKVLEETGLRVNILKKGQSYEAFDKSKKVNSGIHCITTVFVTAPVEMLDVKIDNTADDYKWIDYCFEDNLHVLLKKMIKDNI